MPTIDHKDFGKITIRRSAMAKSIRISVAPNGSLRVSVPQYTPLFLVKAFINKSHAKLTDILKDSHKKIAYHDGMQIGKSHHLVIISASKLIVKRHKQQIIVNLPANKNIDDLEVINNINKIIIQALRIEAKSYLPKRLSYLARQYAFNYEKVRFSHSSGRWGSCSSSGVISLNIALMKLPFDLIDYVLIHELSHTVHMNHSKSFWIQVETCLVNYKSYRSRLKNESPSI